MKGINHNQNNLPVLTELVRPAAVAPGAPGRGVVKLRPAVNDADKTGYDPYNNAPPAPVDKVIIR